MNIIFTLLIIFMCGFKGVVGKKRVSLYLLDTQ